ncbi:MAG: hypothetical protein WKF84_30585 [Pyrinomonadaceae bacterium]
METVDVFALALLFTTTATFEAAILPFVVVVTAVSPQAANNAAEAVPATTIGYSVFVHNLS